MKTGVAWLFATGVVLGFGGCSKRRVRGDARRERCAGKLIEFRLGKYWFSRSVTTFKNGYRTVQCRQAV